MSDIAKEERALVKSITHNQKSGAVSTATLHTDDRILARITDGIYRQPASALRELIANAYDADARNVIIHTDAPRFHQIRIRDDGNGMDIAALARLIHHIGGSVKRRPDGVGLGITGKKDPTLSPKGRRLIGKIGIGLFSVAQLTRHFQIITKVRGKDYRLVAEVILKTYAEDLPQPASTTSSRPDRIETGTVRIVSVPAEDKASHGTEVILMDLRQQARDVLESKDIWNVANAASSNSPSTAPQIRIPSFHIGQVSSNSDILVLQPKLPWCQDDKPEERFRKLYQGIVDEIGSVEQNPRLETTLDNYLRMLWTLSLSAPLDYIEEHPFDLRKSDDFGIYQLLPNERGQARKLSLRNGETVRDHLGFEAPERGSSNLPFRVYIDDVELRRPIRYRDLPQTTQALKKPILFFGSAAPDLGKISSEERGGDLAFEAYFLWAPKIVPKENNGLLIRIADASGTLFDETFAKYQVSELTRLKQITAEIFVRKGLDAALNIDRESFNQAHPHYQIVMRWVHFALRQIMNTLKQEATEVRNQVMDQLQCETEKELDRVVRENVARVRGDSEAKPADISILISNTREISNARKQGHLALDGTKVFRSVATPRRTGKQNHARGILFRKQIRAVAQVLDAYRLLDNLTYDQQEELLQAIVDIFTVDKGRE